jgi:hypothetical protein
VADTPDFLTLRRNRDRSGTTELWVRRSLLMLVALLLLAGLLNLFGQRPGSSTAAVSAASLKLYAPGHVRGGLYFEARFTIDARQDLKDAFVVLDPGWVEGMTINTIEPSPVGEASRDGKLALDLGHIPAGTTYLLFLQIQVNPTNVGRRSQDAELYDGNTFLTRIDRTITVFP